MGHSSRSGSTVAVVFGTRPEAIKLAPVLEALRRDHPRISVRVVATAQHRELLDQVLETWDIAPHVDLGVMTRGQSLDQVMARVVTECGRVFDGWGPEGAPGLVLVQGDTTTVFAAALAAFYRKIPVGHVEAGLRSHDLLHPFPEEANRCLTSRIAALHFAPTRRAADNLLREGVGKEDVHVTGNTVIDAVEAILERTEAPDFPFLDPGKKLVLMTAHRRESFGEPLRNVMKAVRRVAEARGDVQFVYPVHPNPKVREAVKEVLGDMRDRGPGTGEFDPVALVEPLGYVPFVHLMKRARVLLTDSGGIQEEGTGLGKPILILRDVTERPEAVACGSARLVGTDAGRIAASLHELLEEGSPAYEEMARPRDVFGDGTAGRRIAAICAEFLGRGGPGPDPQHSNR